MLLQGTRFLSACVLRDEVEHMLNDLRISATYSGTSAVYDNGERVYPCRCGQIHRGDYAEYDFAHHECFHDSPLIPNGDQSDFLCADCGKAFHIAEKENTP